MRRNDRTAGLKIIPVDDVAPTNSPLPAHRRGGIKPSTTLLEAIKSRDIESVAWALLEEHVSTNKGERSFARDAASLLSQITQINKNKKPGPDTSEEEELNDWLESEPEEE